MPARLRVETLTAEGDAIRLFRARDEPQAFMPPQSGVAANGLPIFNWDQAAAQIARESGGWGAGAVVTYGFRASEPAQMPSDVSGFQQFTAAQIAITIESLALWSEVANITFVRVQTSGEYTNNATMLFGNYTSGADGASAFAFYPGGSANAGDVWVNFSLESNNSNLVDGAFGPHIIAHEIGHAIGLGHNADPAMLMCGRPAPCRPDAFISDQPRLFPLTEEDRSRLRAMYPPDWKPN
jgi:hypothetical protein